MLLLIANFRHTHMNHDSIMDSKIKIAFSLTYFARCLPCKSLKSHDNFLLSRLISFVSLGHSSVDSYSDLQLLLCPYLEVFTMAITSYFFLIKNRNKVVCFSFLDIDC